MFRSKLLVTALALALIALSVSGGLTVSAAQMGPEAVAANVGTAFTYQGRLLQGGSPANGSFSMTFRLNDDPAAGTLLGTVGPQSMAVANGLFNVVLDFGQNVFDGQARWLEIEVAGTTLSPRQPLTPSPYALALPGLWTQQNATSPNLIGGYHANSIGTDVVGATIGGGGHSGNINAVSADYGTIGGGNMNSVTCLEGTVAGGQNNQAIGNQAFIGGGKDNVAGSTTSLCGPREVTIGGGLNNTASGDRSTIAGGSVNRATAGLSFVGGGSNNSASGLASTVAGGSTNRAVGDYATVPGGYHANATHYGEMAYASGYFAAAGDAQSSLYVLRGTSISATPKELSMDNSNPTPVEYITIADGRTVAFEIQVAGRSQSGTSAGYLITGVIENVGGITAFIGTPTVTLLGEDDAGMDAQVSANDTNDRLAVQVTGIAATNIRWVATVRTTEVSFP